MILQHDDRGHQHHDRGQLDNRDVDNDPRAVDHNRGQHQLSFNVYCQVNNRNLSDFNPVALKDNNCEWGMLNFN